MLLRSSITHLLSCLKLAKVIKKYIVIILVFVCGEFLIFENSLNDYVECYAILIRNVINVIMHVCMQFSSQVFVMYTVYTFLNSFLIINLISL